MSARGHLVREALRHDCVVPPPFDKGGDKKSPLLKGDVEAVRRERGIPKKGLKKSRFSGNIITRISSSFPVSNDEISMCRLAADDFIGEYGSRKTLCARKV